MAGRSKRIDTKVSILLGLHLPLFLSLAQIRDRRPLRYGERQSGYHCVSFANYSQFTDSVLLHMRVILHKRDITVSRNSLAWIFCTTPTNCTRYTVGRDDSAHRLYPTCTIYPVGRPLATHTTVNRHVNFPFSIINSQLLQIAKCNLSLQHLLRDQPQIGIIQLPFGLHAAQQHLIHRQHRVERLLRE